MKPISRANKESRKLPHSDLTNALNIGSTLAKRLHSIGVHSLAELATLTPAKAYREICKQNPGKTMPVCYNLYALQGALLGVHWDTIPVAEKNRLRKEAGIEQS